MRNDLVRAALADAATTGQHLLERPIHLESQRRRVAIVAENSIGRFSLAVKRPLSGFATIDLGRSPAPCGRDPGQAHFARGIDEEDRVAIVAKACFEEERCVDDERFRPRRRVREQCFAALFDERVDEAFELLPFLQSREDDRRHSTSVDLAVVIEDARPPPSDEPFMHARIMEDVARHRIRVADEATELTKLTRDKRLAAADAAHESDDRNRIHLVKRST